MVGGGVGEGVGLAGAVKGCAGEVTSSGLTCEGWEAGGGGVTAGEGAGVLGEVGCWGEDVFITLS